MPFPVDLPDYSPGRRVVADPAISALGGVFPVAYDSGILDVGAFTELIVKVQALGPSGQFHATVNFYADANGSFLTYQDDIVAAWGFGYFVGSYPTVGRYFRLVVSEITATANPVLFIVIPSVGPVSPVFPAPISFVNTRTSIGTGATFTLNLYPYSRSVYDLRIDSFSPMWEITLYFLGTGGVWSTHVDVTHSQLELPYTARVNGKSSPYMLQITNLWANAAYFAYDISTRPLGT